MFVIKFVGVVLIVISGAFIGFFKSNKLVRRQEKLLLFSDGVNELHNYIDQGELELRSALDKAFSKCNFLKFKDCNILCDDNDLKNDKRLIEDFFAQLGYSSKKLECDRIDLFKLKLKSKLNEAHNDVVQKCRIYITLGICFGLIVGILLV